MADINKSALLILNDDHTKFLVTRKNDITVTQWLLPGGRIEEGESAEQALIREIDEELGCTVYEHTLEFVGEYEAQAAGRPGQYVNIKLFTGKFEGVPETKSEIKELGWLSRKDEQNEEASEIIRVKLIPDLIARGILHSFIL